MKKKYFCPHMEVVIVNVSTLLAGSLTLSNEVTDQDALSRGFDWDEDY